MKPTRTLVATLFSLFCVCACVTSAPLPVAPPPVSDTIAAIDSATVALITPESPIQAYCTGVWVSERTILTAGHCAADTDIGETIFYASTSESPPLIYRATLARIDAKHDLALLHSSIAHTHGVMHLATHRPERGTTLHFVGHTKGYVWSYARGYVAGYRSGIGPADIRGDYMQVSAPISFGNSGGGAVTDEGELVGIASFMRSDIPEMAFCVPLDMVRMFLSQ